MNSVRTFRYPAALEQAYLLVERELEETVALIRQSMAHDDPFLNSVLDYGCQLGGKRLRPLLTLLTGKAFGNLTPNHFRAAAAVEMVHTGTLIHDDILDGALFRRHLETLHLRWDSRTAVLAGDYLLTQAVCLVSGTDNPACYDLMAQACRQTCEGELLQTALVGNFAMTEAEYRRVIGGKTASLLECSTRMGALFAGADQKKIDLLGQFGHSIGMAFQILDDLLDLIGESDTMGKTLGTDLVNKKPTLPLILYLRDADAAKRDALLAKWDGSELSDEDRRGICAELADSGYLTAARRQAEEYVAAGLEALDQAVCDNGGEASSALKSVADFVLSRNC